MNFSKFLKKTLWFIDAYIAAKKYPLNQSLTYLGVTGTDGKTTTSTYLYEIARNLGYKPLLITTVGAKFDGIEVPLNIKSTTFLSYSIKTFLSSLLSFKFLQAIKAILFLDKKGFESQVEQHRTTPLGSEIRKTILEYESKGANLFIIETTSHALDQYRVYGILFDSIAFTNITNEHLDYHGTWENYASTKAKLIKMLKSGGSVAINRDDEKSFKFLKEFIQNLDQKPNLIEYQINDYENINTGEFFINLKKENNLLNIFASNKYEENSYKASIKLLGKYNIYNAIAAFACFYGFNSSNIIGISEALTKLKGVSGRMEVLNLNPKIIVDYAHTPNAMHSVLESLSDRKGRIWVIFGCTGLRDKYKRSVMGKIAFDLANNILITADDVRTESLYEINNQIISGFKDIDIDFTINTYYPELKYDIESEKFIIRFDEPNPSSRANAISYAIKHASPDDTIVILGIGHQNSILIGNTDYEWSDIEFVKKLLSSKE